MKEGDTLTRISLVFGVDLERLRATNSLVADMVKPGDRMLIPNDEPTAPPAIAPANHREAPAERIRRTISRDGKVYHTVLRGDTLWSIAVRYKTGLDNLLHLNGLRKSSRLSIGQILVVRHDGPRMHIVSRGENLFRIGARYGISVAVLMSLNRLDGDKIAVGQRLLLEQDASSPGSVPPPLAAPEPGARETSLPLVTRAEPTAGTAVTGDDRELSSPVSVAARAIDLARTMLGIPYRFGGTTLRGIDCSAYVQRVFGLMDVRLPRTAREQYAVGSRITWSDLEVGDLVFFRTYASFPSHVGIYLGDSLFIHASSMVRKVTIDSIEVPYYRERFLGARRLLADQSPSLAAAP